MGAIGERASSEQPTVVGNCSEVPQKHSQVCLRWLLQKNIVPLPKSSKEKRSIENAKVFDFELDGTDMSIIGNMPPCGGFCVDADNAHEDE